MIFPRIRLRTLFAAVAIASASSLLGCDRSTTDRDIVWVTPQEAMQMAAKPMGTFGSKGLPRTLWLDPRLPDQFTQEHLPGATNIPFPEISKSHEATCKDFDLFIVYDSDYDDVMAKAASKRLLELGYDQVVTIRGGVKAWQRDGLEIDKGTVGVVAPK